MFNKNCSFSKQKVWDASSDASISFRNEDGSNLACVVENDLIQASLNQNLKQYENVSVLYSNKVTNIKQEYQSVQLKLTDEKTINTKLVIGENTF